MDADIVGSLIWEPPCALLRLILHCVVVGSHQDLQLNCQTDRLLELQCDSIAKAGLLALRASAQKASTKSETPPV